MRIFNILNRKYLTPFILISLGIIYSSMHWNFIYESRWTPINIISFQSLILDGKLQLLTDLQTRILFPLLVKTISIIIRNPFLLLFFAEAICSIFAFYSFFLLAKKLINDEKYALLSTILFSIYAPYAFQSLFRYGELLIVGFFCVLLYCILEEKYVWFVFFLLVASLQRPDIAVTSSIFNFIYSFHIKKERRYLFNTALLALPFITFFSICGFYGITFFGTAALYGLGQYKGFIVNFNMLFPLFIMYLPISALSLLFFRYFDITIKLILLSLLPYLISIAIIGIFYETRLFFPLISILIIGVIKAMKKEKLLEGASV